MVARSPLWQNQEQDFGSSRPDSSLKSYCTSVICRKLEGRPYPAPLPPPLPEFKVMKWNAHHLPTLELILRNLSMSKIILALSKRYGMDLPLHLLCYKSYSFGSRTTIKTNIRFTFLSDREIDTILTVIVSTWIKWIQHGVFLHKQFASIRVFVKKVMVIQLGEGQ